jgi:hypothetical protein
VIASLVALAYADLDWGLCPRERLEHLLATNGVDHVRERDAWSGLLADARHGDCERELARRSGVHSILPPEGISWTRWAEWLEERLTEVAADPSSVVDLPAYLPGWRSCSGDLAPESRDVVQRALAGVQPPEGSSVRDYLVVDASRTVGSVAHAEDPRPQPTRRIGVVVERTDRFRVLKMNAVDPEVDERFPEWRSRWPALTAALGGWFSDAALGGGDPWFQQVSMLATETEEVLATLVREGRELLQLEDEDVLAFVASAGSCIQPPHLRSWFEWMFWRIETFEWKKPA